MPNFPLNEAWAEINALGGYAEEGDKFGEGVNYTVERALFIIEKLGGRDPLRPLDQAGPTGRRVAPSPPTSPLSKE
jgi:hypothetical protein